MNRQVFRFSFGELVSMQQVEETLLLSVMAVESLHGATAVRLGGSYALDLSRRVCVVDATAEVGQAICRIFTGLLSREIGDDAFQVTRARPRDAAHPVAAAA